MRKTVSKQKQKIDVKKKCKKKNKLSQKVHF